jgi:hypothetical protein
MSRRLAALGGMFGACFCFVCSAWASELFGVTFPGTTSLYSINQSSGALSAVGSTGRDGIGDLTSDPVMRTLWAVRISSNELIKIDPVSGTPLSTIPILNTDGNITGLALDPVTHTLYGNTTTAFSGGSNKLYKIDLNGNSTLIGSGIGFENVFALGFDQTGRLFGIANAGDELISISTTTGAGTLISTISAHAAFDIASRPEDNVMFLADSNGGSDSLYTINTSTGALNLVGSYSSAPPLSDTNIVGLAFMNPVPEPSTIALVVFGLAFLVLSRKPTYRARANRRQP